MDDVTVKIILPPRDEDAVSNSLRRLTEKLNATGLADGSGYGLGGEFGYGAAFENDVFMMHPYCWCERDDCLWCGADCGCESRPCGHFLDGEEVGEATYEAWHSTIHRPLPWKVVPREREYVSPPDWWSGEPPPPKTHEYLAAEAAFDAYIEERDRRSGRIFRALVHTCEHPMFYSQTEDIRSKYAPQPYPTSAPHFWHKPSGARVWWYKYIGRDMLVSLGGMEWHRVIRECFDSIVPARPASADSERRE